MWQDFFYFSKTEKRGIVVLMLLCLILLVASSFWPDASRDPATDFSSFQQAVAAWQENSEEAATPSSPSDQQAGIPALFDPNAPEREVLAALDLSERAIRAWLSYTAKGGRFRHPVDLDKFRALTPTERQRVKPYLRFPEPASSAPKNEAPDAEVEPAPLRPFDPNQISREELIAFGVPAQAANNWTKFLEAGGRFRQAADIGKIYGLPPSWSERLQAFAEVAVVETNRPVEATSAPPPRTMPIVDINQASAAEWQQLYGIGPVLSERIVFFREKLGGFYAVRQVGETYGLPDSTFQRILPQLRASALLRPLYLNQLTEQELAAHPYVHRLDAQLIANYRREHGPFQSIDDLDKLYGLDDSFVEKMRPYLVFE